VLQSKEEPPTIISLVPDEYVNPIPIPQAIDLSLSEYESGQLMGGIKAIFISHIARSWRRLKWLKVGSFAAGQTI
jgi:uncharacterized protein